MDDIEIYVCVCVCVCVCSVNGTDLQVYCGSAYLYSGISVLYK